MKILGTKFIAFKYDKKKLLLPKSLKPYFKYSDGGYLARGWRNRVWKVSYYTLNRWYVPVK